MHSASILIGCVVVIFIISIALLLFAPKTINYYTDLYPVLQIFTKPEIKLINEEYNKVVGWVDYPDNKIGSVKIFPLYMFNTVSPRLNQCPETHRLLTTVPNLKSCSFLKIFPKSGLTTNRLWKDIANKSMRCILTLDCPHTTVEKCYISVNGESRKLEEKKFTIYDGSKEHSIINKTDMPIDMLVLDIARPDTLPVGVSEREFDDEINDFIKKLNDEKNTENNIENTT